MWNDILFRGEVFLIVIKQCTSITSTPRARAHGPFPDRFPTYTPDHPTTQDEAVLKQKAAKIRGKQAVKRV